MATIIGTHHFKNEAAAFRYYSAHEGEYTLAAIRAKLKEGAIAIGPPACKHDGTDAYYLKEGRFYIVRADNRAEGEDRSYTIKKFRQDRKGRVIQRGLTLIEARAYVEDEARTGPGFFYGWTKE
jgi:hypothetical protein